METAMGTKANGDTAFYTFDGDALRERDKGIQNKARKQRDRLWCEAVVKSLDTDGIELVVSEFNRLRAGR
jgi:hypothetical protein